MKDDMTGDMTNNMKDKISKAISKIIPSSMISKKQKTYKDPDKLIIDNVKIARGQTKKIEMLLAKLFDHTNMTIKIHVIRGKKPGPILFVSSTIHGDEINGIASIQKLLSKKNIISNINGTLILVPIVNMFGFNRNIRYLPDRRDLNRSFPGSKQGSLTSQIAYHFMNEVIKKCDYGIDLHTGSNGRTNLPQIRANINGSKEMEDLARSFGVPVILSANNRDGSLRQAASENNVKILLFEGGEALRFDNKAIDSATYGIISVMHKIKMLKNIKDNPVADKIISADKILFPKSSSWIRAPHSGILNINKNLGNKIVKGEIIASISDAFGEEKIYIHAKKDGIIIGMTLMPLVTNGDAIIHVAYDI